MSSNSTTYSDSNQMQVNTDLKKLFPFGKEQRNYNYTNSAYTAAVLLAGTIMGVVKTTGKVIPLVSTATDGSQYSVGVLAGDYTVDAGANAKLSVAIRGDVRRDMLLLQGSDTLSTVVDNRRIEDRLEDRMVIRTAIGNTRFDNALT